MANQRMRWGLPADAERIANYHHECRLLAFTPIVGADALADLEPELERWQNWLSADSEFTTVVAIDDDDVPIGHATVRGFELIHLFIDPAHHRRGLGRQLLEVGERLIARAGHTQAQLHTRVGNEPAIALYEATGWVMTDETEEDTMSNGITSLEHIMRKDLAVAGHVDVNRQTWDADADNWVERGRRSWAAEPHWGEMAIPESQVNALPRLDGRDVVELGCGTGYVSAWCLRAGAKSAVGVDNSLGQLRSAQILQGEFDQPFPLIWANAEQVPLADNCCDVVVNEYGAAMWCDPHVWIPEAARLLRPGGNLMFLTWSTVLALSAPDFDHERTSEQLLRPQRDLHRVVFPDTDGVEFALSHGEWISLLTSHGFVIDRLIELYAPTDESGPDRYSYYDAAWARQWPPEEMWCLSLNN